jgi:hypothetical protein
MPVNIRPCIDDDNGIVTIMLVRSSFRDTISRVKKSVQTDEHLSNKRIHFIKYESFDNSSIDNEKIVLSKCCTSQMNLPSKLFVAHEQALQETK